MNQMTQETQTTPTMITIVILTATFEKEVDMATHRPTVQEIALAGVLAVWFTVWLAVWFLS
jgi:hypothetical protein